MKEYIMDILGLSVFAKTRRDAYEKTVKLVGPDFIVLKLTDHNECPFYGENLLKNRIGENDLKRRKEMNLT